MFACAGALPTLEMLEEVRVDLPVRSRACSARGSVGSGSDKRDGRSQSHPWQRRGLAPLTLVTIAGPPEARPADGLAIDFVVLPDRAQLGEIVRRVRDGRLRANIGSVATLDDAVTAFNPTERISGQTIIRVRL